jgi:hypothetical protein
MDLDRVTRPGLRTGLVPGTAILATQEDPGTVALIMASGAVISGAGAANTGEDPLGVTTAVVGAALVLAASVVRCESGWSAACCAT